jgi:hypothetical protein
MCCYINQNLRGIDSFDVHILQALIQMVSKRMDGYWFGWSDSSVLHFYNHKETEIKSIVCFPVFKAMFQVFRHGGDFPCKITFFVNSFLCSRDLYTQCCTCQRPHICTAYHAKMAVKERKLT